MRASKELIESAYNLHAKNYDLAVKLYRLIGLNIEKYRLRGVELLQLKPGDFVLDIGCGTGLNFRPLIQQIGPQGRIIGVDISSEMLSYAKERIKTEKWDNVDLVHSDINSYKFPNDINGVISTGVFGYLNERDKILETISQRLV
ncbi:MAG: methyltransferase domain-containing protein, partial [Candidatus Dadabacteria bacterium]|nr:methyltransferase domain-containing protein [Candidatus Dadabacteria bacterium]NIQ16954.1 methyltransferase domain-containing protein [Candidatus Dadabacteria bacterium]